MKLNLQCGIDAIAGYKNIDIKPAVPGVEAGDFRNLTAISDGSVEEIRAINVLQLVHRQELTKTLTHWHTKLQAGGVMYIQAIDGIILANSMAYRQASMDDANKLIFGNAGGLLHLGLYELVWIEETLNQLGFKTLEKGYQNTSFFIRVKKV